MNPITEMDKIDIDYIIKHNGSCSGGICSTCIITKVRGMVAGCDCAEALKIAQDLRNII